MASPITPEEVKLKVPDELPFLELTVESRMSPKCQTPSNSDHISDDGGWVVLSSLPQRAKILDFGPHSIVFTQTEDSPDAFHSSISYTSSRFS